MKPKTAKIFTRAACGMSAPLVTVEVHISPGMPGFMLVGLPEKAVRESKERVRSALINSGFDFPQGRIVINLAPADLPKQGSRFDLSIAIGIVLADGQIGCKDISQFEFAGELALTGECQAVNGILPFAMACKTAKRQLFVPQQNQMHVAVVSQLKSFAAKNLLEVVSHLTENKLLTPITHKKPEPHANHNKDFSEVFGQPAAKRAMEIAACGNHSLLLRGPPGVGKTMLASRLPGILPTPTEQESLETAAMYSICNTLTEKHSWGVRPFRAPHHSASCVALVGGGNPPQPGEISLAHNGVLFLDELPEFSRHVLESLREPMESHCVKISRAAMQVEFPAHFQLIAAMNPCPCGFYNDGTARCHCSKEAIKKYQAKISGPLLDRIDMHLDVYPIAQNQLFEEDKSTESSQHICERVMQTRSIQRQRANKPNALLTSHEIKQYCQLKTPEQTLLINSAKQLQLSPRAIHRILKVARTLADMANSPNIQGAHLAEAMGYRVT